MNKMTLIITLMAIGLMNKNYTSQPYVSDITLPSSLYCAGGLYEPQANKCLEIRGSK